MSTQNRPRGGRRLVAVAGVVMGLASSCGGGGDDPQIDVLGEAGTEQTETGSRAETTTPAGDDGLPPDQPFTVGHEVWHSGFRLGVGDGLVVVEENFSGDRLTFVTIDVTFENLGPDETRFSTPINLVVDGLAAIRADDRTEMPRVPAGLTAAGTLAFLVDQGFDRDSAQLVIGLPDDKHAQIPLGAGGELVALPPSEPAIAGTLAMELVDLEVTSAELRSDVPVRYSEVGEGQFALTLHFDAVSRRSGNWKLFPDNFALIGPDGNARPVDGADLHNLIGSDEGTLTPDHYVRFVIEEPTAGDYTLRFTPGDALLGDDGVTEAALDFALG